MPLYIRSPFHPPTSHYSDLIVRVSILLLRDRLSSSKSSFTHDTSTNLRRLLRPMSNDLKETRESVPFALYGLVGQPCWVVSRTTDLAKELWGLKLKCLPLKLRVCYRYHSSLSTAVAGRPWRLSMVFVWACDQGCVTTACLPTISTVALHKLPAHFL